MSGETMTLIATQTVGAGGAGGFDFTSIPQTYTDLVVKLSARSSSTSTTVYSWMAFNLNYSTTAYAYRRLDANGSSVTSASATNSAVAYFSVTNGANQTANTFSNTEIYIPNYTNSATKAFSSDSVTENNGTVANQTIWAMSAAIGAPITAITLSCADGSYVQYTTASLYGILKGSGGATVA